MSEPVSEVSPKPLSDAGHRLVWDLPLRLFHWLFALSILASYITAKLGFTWMRWHMRLGLWMIGLLVFRIVWGFIGPRHARFGNFLVRPSALWRYAKGLPRRASAHSIGHNPLGGLMVVVMLLLVAVQVGTGLFATDDILWTGPYYPAVSNATAEFLTGIHLINFDVIVGAIALHIVAIAFYGFYKRQNLVGAMFHGVKPARVVPAHEAISGSQLVKALVVALVAAGAVYWLLSAAPPPPPSVF